mmetsp:Transcript_1889/g.5897  ORF Transcript_1889/g.5897 Transcript_1889/m.5897 type:complete len:321 (-) Transcript_1889:1137-2099(-)
MCGEHRCHPVCSLAMRVVALIADTCHRLVETGVSFTHRRHGLESEELHIHVDRLLVGGLGARHSTVLFTTVDHVVRSGAQQMHTRLHDGTEQLLVVEAASGCRRGALRRGGGFGSTGTTERDVGTGVSPAEHRQSPLLSMRRDGAQLFVLNVRRNDEHARVRRCQLIVGVRLTDAPLMVGQTEALQLLGRVVELPTVLGRCHLVRVAKGERVLETCRKTAHHLIGELLPHRRRGEGQPQHTKVLAHQLYHVIGDTTRAFQRGLGLAALNHCQQSHHAGKPLQIHCEHTLRQLLGIRCEQTLEVGHIDRAWNHLQVASAQL